MLVTAGMKPVNLVTGLSTRIKFHALVDKRRNPTTGTVISQAATVRHESSA